MGIGPPSSCACAEYGVYEWFLDPRWRGQGWDEEQIVRGYLALSAACLTTTFIITQRTGACRRIAGCDNEQLKQRLLPGLASGELFATVGISHLTTSRRHLAKPVLTAEAITGGFRLDGMSPWVTGGAAADVLVLAATETQNGQPTDRQLLIAVPRNAPGLTVPDPLPLIGVSASSTGPVQLDGVEVTDDWLIAGPLPNVMASGIGASTGGHETSTLAIGLAGAAIDFLSAEVTRRADLQQPAGALRAEHSRLLNDLLGVARRHHLQCCAWVPRPRTCCARVSRPRRHCRSCGVWRPAHNRRTGHNRQQGIAAPARQQPRPAQARPRWPPPKVRVMSWATRPAAGAARRCSFSCGAARNQWLPRTCAN